MCLIIKKPEGVLPSLEFLENVYLNNRDGWGVMYAKDGHIHIDKGMTFSELFGTVRRLQDEKLYIHMRKATVGDVSLENTHPFLLEGGAALMHNGTIQNIKVEEHSGYSDSYVLANMLSELLKKFGKDIFLENPIKEFIRGYIDSRLLVLFPDGEELIITDRVWYFYEKEKVTVSNLYAWNKWALDAPKEQQYRVFNIPARSSDTPSNTTDDQSSEPKVPVLVKNEKGGIDVDFNDLKDSNSFNHLDRSRSNLVLYKKKKSLTIPSQELTIFTGSFYNSNANPTP